MPDGEVLKPRRTRRIPPVIDRGGNEEKAVDYYDRNGNLHKETTGQDVFLKLLYGELGRKTILPLLIGPTVSDLGGRFLNTRLSALLIPGFVRRNHIDLGEYMRQEFSSYNDFFTREIRPEFRPLCPEPDALISPCDGRLTICPIGENTLFSIKNSSYTISSLLKNPKLAARYTGGEALIFRLTVDNYHHYCWPADGYKSRNIRIPGVLHTVNPVAVESTTVYHENSREYCVLRTDRFGTIVMMEVGAMIVGKISNLEKSAGYVKRGNEKGCFEFGGSTVILLLEKNRVHLMEDLRQNSLNGFETKVKMGEKIGEQI